MLLWNKVLRDIVFQLSEEGYPEEVCGFLIGNWENNIKTIAHLLPTENNWVEAGDSEFAEVSNDFSHATRRRRFKIPSEEYYRADIVARERNETILGFYHSHPDHPARPSSYDLRLAQEIFPGFSYIIVSVIGGRATEVTSWVLRDDYSQFDSEALLLSST